MSFLMKRPTLAQSTIAATQNQIPTFQAAKPITFAYGRIPFQGANWISDSFNWLTAPPPGKVGSPFEYCSIAGAFCQGPVDFVGRVMLNGVEIVNLDHIRTSGDGDYIEYTFNGSMALGQPWYMRLYFGTETQTADAYLISGTGQQHPAYRGICWAVFHNIDLGQGNTYIPDIQIELGRKGIAVGTYAAAFEHPYGINPFIGIYGLLTDDMGGLDVDSSLLDPTFWAAQATALEATGIGARTGILTFLHPVVSEFKDAASVLSEWLAYVDGYLYCRNGQLRCGWFPHQQISASGLTQISEQDLSEKPSGGGFTDWNGGLSDAVVTFLDVNQEYTQQAATCRAPANRETQVALSPQQIDRPLCHFGQQAALIASETANSFTQDDNGTTLKIFRSRAVNPDGSPLMPGDLFNWVYDPQEIDIVVRVIERDEENGSAGSVSLTVIYERGAFPLPYVAPPDSRVLPTQPAAENVTSANARIWVLPSGFGADTLVTALVDRQVLTDIGANLFYSPNGSSPWEQINTQTFFPAKGAASGAIGSGDATVTIVSTSLDMIRMQAQSATAQLNDELLLLIGDELMSVGSITVVGTNTYQLGVLRGRQNTLPAAHSSSAKSWLIIRQELQSCTYADFANLYSGGVYSGSVATKYFQVQLFTINAQGTPTPAAPGIALTIPDPVPAVPTGLAAVCPGGPLVALTWNPNTEEDFDEYDILRSTTSGSTGFASIGKARSTHFEDAGVVVGTQYWYAIASINENEKESAQCASVTVTPSGVAANSTLPQNAGAASLNATGATVDGAGTSFAYLDINVPAMPGATSSLLAAAWQNVLYRVHGATNQWQIGAQVSNTGAVVVRIDLLSPNVSYDIALQAFTSFGVPSVIVAATGSPFTTAQKTAAPANPSGFAAHAPSSSYPLPAAFYSGVQAYGATITFTSSTAPDIAGYEWGVSATPGLAPSTVFGTLSAAATQFPYYSQILTTQEIWIRAFDRSGNRAAWLDTGLNMNAYISLAAGSISVQNTNAVSVSGLQVGNGAGSMVQVIARAPINTVVTLAGGSAEESFNISLSGKGFNTKPDGTTGPLNVASDRHYHARYDWDDAGNSSTNAVVKVSRFDGTNTSNTAIRMTGEFFENA